MFKKWFFQSKPLSRRGQFQILPQKLYWQRLHLHFTCQCVLLPVCSNWQSAVSHGGLASEGIVNPSNENIKYVKSAKAGEFMNPIFAMKVIMLSHPCLPSPALSGGSINPAIWCLYSNAFSTSCRDPSLARGCSHSVVNVFGPYLPFKKIPDSYNACSKNCLIDLIFEPKWSNTFLAARAAI